MDTGKRNVVLAVVGVLALGFFVMTGVHACNERRAESAIREAQSWIANVEKHYADLLRHAERAKTIHARYLGPLGFETVTARMHLDDAKQKLDAAKKKSDASEKIDLANAAEASAKTAEKNINARTEMLNELDSARSGYKSAVAGLYNAFDAFDTRYRKLLDQGYRTTHFAHAVSIVEVVHASMTTDFGPSPISGYAASHPDEVDYLKIWTMGPPTTKKVRDALAELDVMPQLAARNTRDADGLLVKLGEMRARYVEAQSAAVVLENYPNYRCLDSVVREFGSLQRVSSDISEARRENSMEVQDFHGARRLLADATSRVTTVDKRLRDVVARRTEIRKALDTFDEKDSAVSRTIRDADDRIRDNAQNSQIAAKDQLRVARSLCDEAKRLRQSDPIAALGKLDDARSRANEAYKYVDTSSVAPGGAPIGFDDDDDDDTPTSVPSPFGGGGGGGFGSSGPSHSSPVERSPSGGGFHADEPSGGGFRGNDSPSGGGFHNEGPSGGGFRGE